LIKLFTKYAILFTLLCIGTLPQGAFAQTFWSVGMYFNTGQAPISSLNGQWGGLTHLRVDDSYPQSDGSLNWGYGEPAFYATDCAAAHANGVKCILGIADTDLRGAVTNHLSTIVNNIVNAVNTYGLDGVDVDWEATFPNNSSTLTTFFSALRTALGNTKTITADVFPVSGTAGVATYWVAPSAYLDKLNVMNYDLVSGPSLSWFNSALTSAGLTCCLGIDASLGYYAAAGVPKSKLNNGLPFYGWTVNGVSGPRQSGYSLGGQSNYSSIVSNHDMAGAVFDSVSQTPWLPISGGYITYENPQSILAKAKYVKNNGYGGVMIFNLDADYLPSQTPSHPLLAAIQSAMGANSYSAPSITSTSPLPAGTVGTAYSLILAASGTTPFTWSVASGTLANNLTLDGSSGTISGTPATSGTSAFTASASNASGTDSKPFSLTVNPQTAPASWFKLVSKNSGKCLDVPNASTLENIQLQQYSCWGGANQQFQFTPVSGGYKITAKNSGLQVNVRGGTTATQNGAAIIQWPYSGGSNEIWNTHPNTDGTYTLTVNSSGKCMDVSGVSKSNGAKIQQYSCWGGANQKWSLVPVQ